MKRILVFAAVMVAIVALGAEPVVCTVSIGTGGATTTASATTGTCTWNRNSVVLMACDQDVYINTTSGCVGSQCAPAAATSAMQRVNFLSNMDPYPLYLDTFDKDVSMLAVTAAGTCKFMTTKRKRNF